MCNEVRKVQMQKKNNVSGTSSGRLGMKETKSREKQVKNNFFARIFPGVD